jgi:hypothetical protein
MIWKFKIALRRFFLWFNWSKRIKFKRALHKYADRIQIWEQVHDEPPPIVWNEQMKDYVWLNYVGRKFHQKEIKKAIKASMKLPMKKPNRR